LKSLSCLPSLHFFVLRLILNCDHAFVWKIAFLLVLFGLLVCFGYRCSFRIFVWNHFCIFLVSIGNRKGLACSVGLLIVDWMCYLLCCLILSQRILLYFLNSNFVRQNYDRNHLNFFMIIYLYFKFFDFLFELFLVLIFLFRLLVI